MVTRPAKAPYQYYLHCNPAEDLWRITPGDRAGSLTPITCLLGWEYNTAMFKQFEHSPLSLQQRGGGRGSVVRASAVKPERPGVDDPLAGRGEEQSFWSSESTLVQTFYFILFF